MNNLDIKIKKALEKGFGFLNSSQLASGEFITRQWIGDDECIKAWIQPIKSVFITSFILCSLKKIRKFLNVEPTAQKAIKFLIDEKEGLDEWRFYGKYSNIPFDIDTTVCVLSALKEWNERINYESFKTKLMQYETKDNVYLTWKSNWMSNFNSQFFTENYNDIDWVVNSNVLYFHNLLNVNLPKVEEYLIKLIEKRDYVKPSYNYPSISGIYCFSRAYSKHKSSVLDSSAFKIHNYLQNAIIEEKFKDSLSKALSLNSLKNISNQSSSQNNNIIKGLLKQQRKNGSWPIGVFCSKISPKCNKVQIKWGSEELTTALALEAIYKESLISSK